MLTQALPSFQASWAGDFCAWQLSPFRSCRWLLRTQGRAAVGCDGMEDGCRPCETRPDLRSVMNPQGPRMMAGRGGFIEFPTFIGSSSAATPGDVGMQADCGRSCLVPRLKALMRQVARGHAIERHTSKPLGNVRRGRAVLDILRRRKSVHQFLDSRDGPRRARTVPTDCTRSKMPVTAGAED